MKNIIIVLVIVIAGVFLIKQFAPKGKPDDAITKYGGSLKQSEEKAEAAAVTANTAILQGAVNSFKGSHGRFPDNLQELVDKGFMQRIPSGDFSYDSENGVVMAR